MAARSVGRPVHAEGCFPSRRRPPGGGRRCHGHIGIESRRHDLDGTPATIRVLPGIAAAVGDQIEVVIDGGIRRGGDVVKALALGARAVMLGRAYLWGLAADGQAGVENVLDLMRGGIESALLGLGRSSIHGSAPTTWWSLRPSNGFWAAADRRTDRRPPAAGPRPQGGPRVLAPASIATATAGLNRRPPHAPPRSHRGCAVTSAE